MLPDLEDWLLPHLPLLASISRSSVSFASRSSGVGPVPILCNLGALFAPPMKLARLAVCPAAAGTGPWPANA